VETIFDWDDFVSEIYRDLTHGEDIEDIARELKLSPNQIQCWGYKSKPQIPNLKQFGKTLDRVFKSNPAAVHLCLQRLCRRYKLVAAPKKADLLEFLESLARELKKDRGD
jgi:hypothetical protein